VLVEDQVNGKIFALLVDRRSAVTEAILLAGNFLSGLGAFDNHVAFVFGESQQDMCNKLARWRVVD